jgi:hypothetical protein
MQEDLKSPQWGLSEIHTGCHIELNRRSDWCYTLYWLGLEIALKFDVLGPSMLSSGQSSWLQIQDPGSIPGATRFFWEAVGLERGPLSHE